MPILQKTKDAWLNDTDVLRTDVIDDVLLTQSEEDSVVALINTLRTELKNLAIFVPPPEPPPEPPPDDGTPGAPLPDFTLDPLAIVIEAGEERIISGDLRFTTIHGKPGSKLTIRPGANLIKADVPLDTDFDPDQIGHGILIEGEADWRGSPCLPYSRTVVGLAIGDDRLDLHDLPDSWGVGDELVICGSAQPRITKTVIFRPTSEVVTITKIVGGAIEFDPPLVNDHPAGLREHLTPHVANLTRDAKITAENPDNPAHVMFMHGSTKVHVENIQLTHVGRTTNSRVDQTTYNAAGEVVYLASNPIARYALHCHRMGDGGKNVVLKNNSIRNCRRWGIVPHGTNFATIEDNVVFDANGAGISGEVQSEHSNVFSRNLVCKVSGRGTSVAGGGVKKALDAAHPLDRGWSGNGFWFTGGKANILEDNICSDCMNDGIVWTGYGAEPGLKWATDTLPANPQNRNEAYACGGYALTIHSQGIRNRAKHPYSMDVHNDPLGWNLRKHVFRSYHHHNMIINRPVLMDDGAVSSSARGSAHHTHRNVPIAYDFSAGYNNGGITINDQQVEGFFIGVHIPTSCRPEPWFRMIGGYLDCFINVLARPSPSVQRIATIDTELRPSTMDTLKNSLAEKLKDDGTLRYPNIAKKPYDVYAYEGGRPMEKSAKSDIDLPSYRAVPTKVFIAEDPAATCTETDERIRGFICNVP